MPEPIQPVIDIRVDTEDLQDTPDSLSETISAELNRRLTQLSLPPGVFVADDRQLVVQLDPGPMPGPDDLLIHAVVMLDGERLAESTTESCIACTDADVADIAMVLIEPLLAKLPAPEPAEPPPPMLAEAEPNTIDLGPPAQRPDRGLLIGGGALVGAGLVGLGVGVGLIVADEKVVSPPTALELDVIKYRDPGIVVAVLSGAAVVTGAVLLGTALRRRARARTSESHAGAPSWPPLRLVW